MWSSAKASRFTGDASEAVAWTPAAFDLRPPTPPEPVLPASDPVADAYALGFGEGRQEGERAERARMRPTVRAAEEALEAINQQDARWTGTAEQNIITLALAVARHIIEREVTLYPTIVEGLAQRALAAFPVDQPTRVRVNPEDLTLIRALNAMGPLEAKDRDDAPEPWVADPRIGRGGCVVEGRERIVDGRVETALERVYHRLAHQHA
ncbi:MAG: FliH/SctL family protein [Gemmatimonadaceae bacterium]